jgi:hypothetical protein
MLWLLCGYVWLYVHRPWEVWPSLAALQIERGYMLVLLAVWLLWPNKVVRLNRLHIALLLFTFIILASWTVCDLKEETLPIIENHLKILVFVTVLATSVRTEQDLRLMVWAFVISVGLYMSHSLLEYFNGRLEYRMGIRRMVGVDVTSRQSNLFAAVLLTPVPLLVPCWLTTRSTLLRLGVVGYVGLTIVCIAFTGSRAGYITLAVCGLMLAWCSQHRKAALAGFAALVLGVVVALPGFVVERFLTLIDSSVGPENAHTSAMGRLAGLVAGLAVWAKHPGLGTGPGSFAFTSGLNFQAHNLIGQLTADLGTGGVITFGAFLVCFWLNYRQGKKLLRRFPEFRNDFAFLVLRATSQIVLVHLVYGMAGHNLYRFQWYWAGGFNALALQCLLARAEAIGHARYLTQVAQPVRPRPRLAAPPTAA